MDNGRPRVSTYYGIIGAAPICGPADHATALDYLHRIEHAIILDRWTPGELDRLRKLKAKWHRRAFGHDSYFEIRGSGKGGRLPLSEEMRIERKLKRNRDMVPYAIDLADDERRKASCVQSQKRNPERRWKVIDADLPTRPAKGFSDDVGGESDMMDHDPEAGEIALPVIPQARQYLIPGQDGMGHAHRLFCRVMPAHYRAITALERSKAFGFRTPGDVMRWCVDFGVRELTRRMHVPQAVSALAQVDMIREILVEEQYYVEFPQVFESLQSTINKQQAAGCGKADAVRLVAMVRHQIEQMTEEPWREKYMGELMKQFGHILTEQAGETTMDFAGEEA